jgi:Acyl-CoA dehydrogenase, C-terminal domain
MDVEDHRLFEASLRSAVGRHSGSALDAVLDELGWADALAADPRAAISLLFELQGATNSTSSALGRVFAHTLGVEIRPGTGTVLPAVGRGEPPGVVDGNVLTVRGLGSTGTSDPDSLLVITASGHHTLAVTLPAASLTSRRVDGMDPDLALVEVTGSRGLDGLTAEALEGGWPPALALARLARAHELVGASRTMLDLAGEHARSRIQFGRPIGSFQAVRHRLAEALVGIDMAEAMIESAWLDRAPRTAAMAKSVAGRQARTTARHCQQVLAGIGFTTEHPLHRYVRRTLVLDALLGSGTALTRELGSEVIRTSRLPALPPLWPRAADRPVP